MANSILQDRYGPDWPLGFISVAAPGTPVGIMSVVDPNSLNNPNNALAVGSDIQSVAFQQIVFWALKPSAGKWVPNTGQIYVVRAPSGGGSGGRADSGVLVAVIQPGNFFNLASAPAVVNVFGAYRYFIDADNAGDGAAVVGIIQ